MSKILLLGGTGAMGAHLTKVLSEQGHELVVTSRSHRRSSERIRFVQGNALDYLFLQSLLNDQWDAIVDFMVYSTEQFREKVQLLLKSTKHYMFLSSARVYANSSTPITENSPRLLDVVGDEDYLQTDEYALAKARQEDILVQNKQKNWTIIRPYITYGNERFQLGILEKEEWLYRALRGRALVLCEEIQNRITTITHGRDVADAMSQLVGKNSTYGQVIQIVSPEFLPWQKVLEHYISSISCYTQRTPKTLMIGSELFQVIHNRTYQIKYDRLFDRIFDNSKLLSFSPKATFQGFQNGLNSCFIPFLHRPKFKEINWRTEALKDRLTREHASLTEFSTLKQLAKYLIYRYSPYHRKLVTPH